MKKLLSLIFFALISFSIFADEYVISRFRCFDAKYFHDRELVLKYDDKEDVYYIYRSDYSRTYWFTLNNDQIVQLRKNLAKANDWSSIAKENKSTISKELPNSEIKVHGTMKSGNDWYNTRYEIALNFFFISSFENGVEVVSLLIRGGEEDSKENQYIEIEFESVIFANSLIDDFIEAISEDTIEKAKLKH